MFFQGKDDLPRYFDGVLNPVFLFFSPLAFWGKRERWRAQLAGFIVFYFLFSFLLVDMRARYILPTLAPLAVLTALGLSRLKEMPGGKIGVVFAAGLLLLNASYLYAYIHKAQLGPYLLGRESREEYLSRKLKDYDLWWYANRVLPPHSKVIMYFMGDRGYYCNREYVYETYYSGKKLREVLSHSASVEGLRKYFTQERVTHIAIQQRLFKAFVENNFSSAEKKAFEDFRARQLKLLYSGKDFQLYEMKGG